MRRILIIIGLFILTLAIGFGLYRLNQARQATTFEILREATVTRGDFLITVDGTGAVEPEGEVSLTFGIAGEVEALHVVPGQMVTAGKLLAALNHDQLELAVRQAEEQLRIQELLLTQAQTAVVSDLQLQIAEADIAAAAANLAIAEANLAAAEAAVLQAEAARAQLVAGPTAGQVAAAESQVATAVTNQKVAQDTYDQTLQCVTIQTPQDITGQSETVTTCPGLGQPEEQARVALASANAALAAAEAQLADLLAGARLADIQAADAAIANAEAGVLAAAGQVDAATAALRQANLAYDLLLESPDSDEIEILAAQVMGAQINLEMAQLSLEQSQIIAPFSGRIAEIFIATGESVTPGVPVLTMIDETAFHIEANIDEIDIDKIALNQPVEISLDALPDKVFNGTISDIAPRAVNLSGIVAYRVQIQFDAMPDINLRPGMSSSISVTVQEINDVLLVPNWAVRLDIEAGESYVTVVRADDTIDQVTLETGLRNDQFSEVLSGLAAGDKVVIVNEQPAFSLFATE